MNTVWGHKAFVLFAVQNQCLVSMISYSILQAFRSNGVDDIQYVSSNRL